MSPALPGRQEKHESPSQRSKAQIDRPGDGKTRSPESPQLNPLPPGEGARRAGEGAGAGVTTHRPRTNTSPLVGEVPPQAAVGGSCKRQTGQRDLVT